MQEKENKKRDEIFSQTVRAGKRTYFFDVKTTRSEDYYLTITESKKRFNKEQGKFYYEKHKVFLYKEDFDKFSNGLQTVIDYIKQAYEEKGEDSSKLEKTSENKTENPGKENAEEFSNIKFEDLNEEDKKEEDKEE